MFEELKRIIRDQYGWQAKVSTCWILMGGRDWKSKEYQFIRRVRNMYLSQ